MILRKYVQILFLFRASAAFISQVPFKKESKLDLYIYIF